MLTKDVTEMRFFRRTQRFLCTVLHSLCITLAKINDVPSGDFSSRPEVSLTSRGTWVVSFPGYMHPRWQSLPPEECLEQILHLLVYMVSSTRCL